MLAQCAHPSSPQVATPPLAIAARGAALEVCFCTLIEGRPLPDCIAESTLAAPHAGTIAINLETRESRPGVGVRLGGYSAFAAHRPAMGCALTR